MYYKSQFYRKLKTDIFFYRAFEGKTQHQSILERVPLLLNRVLLPAYRSAVKVGLDEIIINGNSVINYVDLEENLKDIDANWYLGMEDSDGWVQAIQNQVPNLFTIICGRCQSPKYENGL